jgi:hypothetical protein
MILVVSAKARRGLSHQHEHLAGWLSGKAGPVLAPVEVTLAGGGAPGATLVRLAIDPVTATLAAATAGGSRHYFRLADATLRPLPAEASLSFARGDAYIAVSPGARLLADSPAIARFLHLRDGFNAERLADGLLSFLAHESGQAEFPEDVTVLVVEAR